MRGPNSPFPKPSRRQSFCLAPQSCVNLQVWPVWHKETGQYALLQSFSYQTLGFRIKRGFRHKALIDHELVAQSLRYQFNAHEPALLGPKRGAWSKMLAAAST